MKEEAYKKSKFNREMYSKWRTKFDEFWKSEKYFFERLNIEENMSILDVGGACGGFGKALEGKFNKKLDIVHSSSLVDRSVERIYVSNLKSVKINQNGMLFRATP